MARQFNTALTQYGQENLGGLDITPAQSVLLAYLLERQDEELSLTEICAKTGITKATISAMLKALKNKGYLIMEAVPGDDRKKKICLTGRAYAVQSEIENRLKKRTECIYKGISAQELAAMESILERMTANLKQETARRKQHGENTVQAGKAI